VPGEPDRRALRPLLLLERGRSLSPRRRRTDRGARARRPRDGNSWDDAGVVPALRSLPPPPHRHVALLARPSLGTLVTARERVRTPVTVLIFIAATLGAVVLVQNAPLVVLGQPLQLAID